MSHRVIELPFASPQVVAIHAGAAWLRSRVGVQVAAVDLVTGEVRHRLQLQSPEAVNPSLWFVDGFLAANVGRSDAVCVEIATGKQAWKRPGHVEGAKAGSFVLAEPRPEGAAALVEVTPQGAPRDVYAAASARYALPRAVVTVGRVWTIAGKELVRIQPDGTARSTALATEEAALVPWRDRVLVLEPVEERSGPCTRLLAPDGEREGLREIAVVPSALFRDLVVAADHVLVGSGTAEAEPWDAWVAPLDVAGGSFAISVPSHMKPAACGSIAAVAQTGALAIVSGAGGVLRGARVPLPVGSQPSVGAGEGLVCAAVSKQLLVVACDALRWGQGLVDQDVTFAPVAASASGDPEPARVVFAGASLVTIDHPRLKRLNLHPTPSSPPLARNDRVVLDAVREELPGLWRVDAWHKEGEAVPAPSAVAPLALAAHDMPAVHAARVAAPLGNLDALLRAGDALCFAVPELMRRLVSEHDRDETFRRWLDRISLLVEITGYTTAWDGSDPCLLGFAGNGGGDVEALYYYPPAARAGASLPVVDWWHETNEVGWIAQDFDAYLAHRLHEAAESHADVVALILERLALPGDFPQPVPAAPVPRWFGSVHVEDAAPPELASVVKLASRDREGAERRLVRLLRDDPESAEIKAALSKVYEVLGWSWHRENLDRTTG